jgi:hypothetical protein
MNTSEMMQIIYFVIPTAIVGFLIAYAYKLGQKQPKNSIKITENPTKNELLQLRIQAYERLILLIERINPSQILLRIVPQNQDLKSYQNEVILQIEKEFEHNITQQIYVSSQCWKSILMAKNTIIQNLFLAANHENVKTVNDFRQQVLKDGKQNEVCELAASFIKKEVQELW